MIDDQPHTLSRRSVLRGSVTLAGTAVVLPALSVLGGCKALPAGLDNHLSLITAIVDRVIPATDTPGALEAGVPAYIAALFEKHFTPEQQAEFVAGLDAVAELAKAEGTADFATASRARQDAVLVKLATGGGPAQAKNAWQQVHDMTVFGFYTSEAATQELAYEEIPGRQIGCLPFAEIGRAWLDRGV